MSSPTNMSVEEHYAIVEPFALARLRDGDERISMDTVFEDARRELKRSLSNNAKPAVATLLRERHPALRDRIQVRPRGRGGKHKPRPADSMGGLLDEALAKGHPVEVVLNFEGERTPLTRDELRYLLGHVDELPS